MEFHKKIQELRKQKGLTQQELAQVLHVSRTAISKWESGKGYPNIESLKQIAAYFSVTVDTLLTGQQVLTIAEEDQKQKDNHVRNVVFGLLDCSSALLWILPVFAQKAAGMVKSVSLPVLTQIAPWLKVAYFVTVIALTAWGILTLAMQRYDRWMPVKSRVSLILNAAGVLLFVLSRQVYAAAFLLLFLVIKAMLLLKKP